MDPARLRRLSPAAVLALACLGCSGPRSVLFSPETTPKGEIRVGGGLDVNVPTQTASALYGGLEQGVESLYDRAFGGDTGKVAVTADSLNDLARALVAYSVDPIGAFPWLSLRYGLARRVDAGYRFAGGVHALDARFQFLGPIGGGPGWRGSLGLQFSSQDYELPAVLGKLQKLLKYEFKRKDFLIPVVFGKPIGAEGRFGSFGLGGAYNAALIEYDSEILRLVERVDGNTVRPFRNIRGKRTLHSFGAFSNARLGYRRVFAMASLAVYRQDYGSFPLFGGEETALAGWTLVPSLGIETRF